MVQRRAIKILKGRRGFCWRTVLKINSSKGRARCNGSLWPGEGTEGKRRVYLPRGHPLKLRCSHSRTMTRKFYLTRSISLLPAVGSQEVAQTENINRLPVYGCIAVSSLQNAWCLIALVQAPSVSNGQNKESAHFFYKQSDSKYDLCDPTLLLLLNYAVAVQKHL